MSEFNQRSGRLVFNGEWSHWHFLDNNFRFLLVLIYFCSTECVCINKFHSCWIQGYALLCVGYPSSDVEVETQDEDEVM